MRLVVDASAVLARVHHEAARPDLPNLIQGNLISAVNIAEIVGKLAQAGEQPGPIAALIDALDLEVISVDEDLAVAAGLLRCVHKDLSLGDRCCLALARTLNLPVLSGDRLWAELRDVTGVQVVMIR